MRRLLVALVAIAGVVGLLMFLGFSAAPLPPLPHFEAPLPPAHAPAEMAMFALPTGVTHRSAGVAYRGGSFSDARDFAMTAVLVKHPKGDVLIEAGFSRDIDAQFQTFPAWFRAVTTYTRLTAVREQLAAAHYDVKSLRGIVLTHAHWDHVSGVADFKGEVPVLVSAAERAYIERNVTFSSLAHSFGDARYETYAFDGGPYLGFEQSHDLHGDGSIVMVPAPGHTPGSVIIFVTLADAKRFAFIGDLAWQREGVFEREERPVPLQWAADSDEPQVRENLRRMSAIIERYPDITLVPAHDARAYESLPRL